MLITLWIRIIVKIILSRFPINYETWKKLGLFVKGEMNNPEYAYNVF